ncbi:phosphoribosyl transferase [Patescibacteria group bacterium]|nr:phosphoribosyl transferase [Patescibacteria group bacterium]
MNNTSHFTDRLDAGRQMAQALTRFKDQNPVVIALPRGGVPIGKVIATELDCPLDLAIVRKIGHPNSPEYAIAVIAEDGQLITNPAEVAAIDPDWFRAESDKEKQEAKRRRKSYIPNHTTIDLTDKTAIIVDDGIATGLTMLAAIKQIKDKNPAKLIVCVPVSPRESADRIKPEVDEFISLSIPDYYLGAVGAYYDSFDQVSDEEVIELMNEA